MMLALLDVSLLFGGGMIGTAIIIAVFFISVASAFFVYKILKRSVKMAIRMIVVAIILLIGVVGSIALVYVGRGANSPVRSTVKATR